jgi:hypothetical protein
MGYLQQQIYNEWIKGSAGADEAKIAKLIDFSQRYQEALVSNQETARAMQYQMDQMKGGVPFDVATGAALPEKAGAAQPVTTQPAAGSDLEKQREYVIWLDSQVLKAQEANDQATADKYRQLLNNYNDAINRGDVENVYGYEQQIDALMAGQQPGAAAGAATGESFQNSKGADTNKIASGINKINDWLHQEYPGIAGLGGMLIGAVPALQDWSNTVNTFFCDTIVLGGKDCWVQKICEASSDYPGGDGTLVDSKWGNNTLEITFYAHVEGQRSSPVESVNPDGTKKTEYLYKVTFAIRNPQKKDANAYQLRFFYPGGSYDWFPGWQPLHKGDYIVQSGAGALVAYSTKQYTLVCLVFQNSVEVNGQSTRQVCNTIAQYGGGPTAYPGAAATAAQGAAAGPPAVAGQGF